MKINDKTNMDLKEMLRRAHIIAFNMRNIGYEDDVAMRFIKKIIQESYSLGLKRGIQYNEWFKDPEVDLIDDCYITESVFVSEKEVKVVRQANIMDLWENIYENLS